MDDIDAMFTHLLGEMDHLSQSLKTEGDSPEADSAAQTEKTFSIGFNDLNESLNELEDNDLDALMADLESKSAAQEPLTSGPNIGGTNDQTAPPATTQKHEPATALPPPPSTDVSCRNMQMREPQTKAEKIKLALEKLKEAKMRKVRSADFLLCVCVCVCVCVTFEDHEHLVEPLSAWTRYSENKIYFLPRPQKYVMFTDPQIFYMWKKDKAALSAINQQAKDLLVKENFGGSTLIVPDLEGTLYLKEDGKKVWKPRYFVLRASGIYFVPKGKTKSSTDLACFVHFEKINIYMTKNYKQKYRAPTNFCFMLKHPCIQKDSPYIKLLCCDDEKTLVLWVNSIRIAKYGTALYKNYQAAMKRASPTKTLQSAAYKAPKTANHTEDYEYEPPPDFIPPPPPERTSF
uniref:Amyloid beta protein binding family B member 1 interacting protein n=1 Tax=Haplochromis burtoni TaxID=8153 RepID=A0A3Q2WBN7_HAPBU